ITDANNCVLSATLEVLKTPGSFTVTLNTTDAVCNGLATGAIDASVANSTGSLSFIWSNNQATEDLTNITAGIYTITVSDTNGCSKTASATVGEASPIVITGVATNPICFGDANGSINLSVTGGAGGYSFLWSNNSASEDVLGLTGGDYSVTVTDLLGCVKSASFTLIQAPSPIQLIANVHHPLCFNETGSIDLFVFGGIGSSFVVNWSSGGVPTTQGLSELQAGTYTVTATDVNGCSASTSATVVAPAALAIGSSGISNIACNTGNSGIIQITAAGGTMPYTYDWSDDGAEFPDNDFQILFNVGPGSYTITITDANGCTFSSPVYEVTGTPSISALASTLSNSCDIAVLQATVSGGVPDFAYQWTGPNNFTSTTQVITAPFGGFYHLIVTDVNGCSASSTTLVELAGAGICGYLRGHVIHDQLENCVWDTNESGLSGWLVRAEGIDTLYGVTDATGQYLIQAPSGDYTIAVIAPNNLWEVCLVPSSATLTNPGDTVFVADIPVKSPFTCPLLRVSIGTNQLRRCFSNNYYYVEYCNEGTETADNAYVVVTLDPLINFISSNIPSTFLGNQQYQFNVGNLDIGECGWFNIKVNVDCNAVLGQTHCTVAHIYPDSLCNTNTLWSGAELDITGRCTADSLHFVVKNTGSGNVVGALDYIVVEDAVMRMMAPVPMLPPGDSIRIHVPANGSTWRMEVEQEIYHPTPTPVSLSVEGCTTGAQFSTGFVNQFPLGDESPATDEDCTTNVGSYDPNDKHGYPIGYGAEHYIRPGTEIEYMIRFQNTGTDTAFNIVVLDTLSELLDPATIRFGTSSHPYQFDLTGGGIVHFYFDNIMLPDSFVNEPLSHGFVKFTITPNAQAPLESLIENQAAIYFDFNEPVITNTTRHRLGENFLTVHAWQPIVRQVGIAVAPNPFNSNAVFTVSGLTNTDPLQLEVFDSFGKAVAFLASETHQFTFSRTTLGAGIYAFSVRQNGRLVGSGKFMVE
ncbi:MAG: SprB repeat-containing protein, partial [Saprospiraceae bacterium]|nr:SprB repeat-containing protein [Saprospiraceae bacterium]